MEKKRKYILSVLIPVYNESDTIGTVIDTVLKVDLPPLFEREIIVVNDASTDDTEAVLNKYLNKIVYRKHSHNKGKGAALRTAFLLAKGDIVVIQDADLEYSPTDWKHMLVPIIDGHADVVYGSRFIGDAPHRVLYFWHYFGNRVITFFSNIFTNLNLTDMETCYKMMTRNVVDSIKGKLVSSRFGIEPEITARVKKFRVYEVGISYRGRTYEEGKKINWRDGLAVFWHIIRFNLFSK
jgi:glycosyltransferase involved in cell wall biosynthesis